MIDPDLSFFPLMAEATIYPKFFWSDKENRAKIYALGVKKKSHSIPIPKAGELWLCSYPFAPHLPLTHPWEKWSLPYFFQPSFAMIEIDNQREFYGNYPWKELPFLAKDEKYILEQKEELPTYQEYLSTLESIPPDLPKVVLAKCTKYISNHEINPWEILSWNQKKTQGLFQFAIQERKESCFLGYSPERLYQRNEDTLLAEAIAGTLPSELPDRDKRESLSQNLEMSNKDIAEFAFVENFVEEITKRVSLKYTKKKRKIIQAGSLDHFYNSFSATLLKDITDRKMVSLFHPTPATLGYPSDLASSFLHDNESFCRGLYAGLIGYITPKQSDFAVGLRSALIQKNHLYTFSGGGIVQESISENEWRELELKENNILEHLHAFKQRPCLSFS